MFLLLPREIFDLILHCLSIPALLSLRGCCRGLLPVITRRVFSEIAFDLSRPRLGSQTRLIQAIANPYCTIYPHVTALDIAALHHSYDGSDNEDEVEDDEDQDDDDDDSRKHNDFHREVVKRTLSEYLSASISKLCNLETIYNIERDSSHLLTSLAKALSSLPLKTVILSIKSHEVDITTAPLPPLHAFKDLHKLSVTCSSDIPPLYCVREIAAAIGASPELSDFTMRTFEDGNRRESIKMCASVQDLFQMGKHQLTRLELYCVPFPVLGMKEILSSRLKELTVSTTPGSRHIDFSWETLWCTLRDTKIALSALAVSGSENALNAMFNYLLTYSGLQKLEIFDVQMDHQEDEDKFAETLCSEVVPCHQQTLITLGITSKYPGNWCYGPLAAGILSQCPKLQALTLSVGSVCSSWAGTILSRARDSQEIQFNRISEPDGSVENCCALTPSDLRTPLAKLTLNVTRAPTFRPSDIYHLDTGTRHKGSPEAHYAWQRRKQTRKNIYAVLLGIRGVRGVVMNWPSDVVVDYSIFRLYDDNESSIYYEEVAPRG
ncbi:hypothetical protein BDV24DRAFT_163422 [Aspergillus arachidicola]|uniref:F-box domain-containing protein n=1 Tax=Aspergillus arachidicola TaxID=656916 RepID=A0A5N6Y7U5_9EURO|nr:hypothetical protein BDV24DRAFT_163422 [Aspergillus arachidicola]